MANPTGTDPRFTQDLLTATVTWVAATAAKTTLNDTVNAVKLLTFGAYGGAIKSLIALPLANVTASRLLVLRRRPADGATVAWLRASKVMLAQTLSNTTETTATAFAFDAANPLRGGALEEIWVGVGVTGVSVNFDAEYENF